MKYLRLRYLIYGACGLALVTGYQNCSQTYGLKTTPSDVPQNSSQSTDNTNTNQPINNPPPTTPPATPTPPPSNVVCDPFNGGGNSMAIRSSLYYLPSGSSTFDKVGDYIKYGKKADTTVFLSQINVSTRRFNLGFATTQGDLLKDDHGNTLFEYFALDMQSKIKLAAADSEGLYQLAVLSDDGSILEIDSGSGLAKVVDNDSTHATKLKCGAAVNMVRGQSLPMRLTYFQGPREHIAVMLLWRKVGSGGLYNDPNYCDVGGSDTWFDSNQTPSAPTAKFQNLLAAGWKVLGTDNYESLSATDPNWCTTK